MLTTLQVQVLAADVTVGDVEASAVRAAGEPWFTETAAIAATIVPASEFVALGNTGALAVGIDTLRPPARYLAGG